MPKNDFQLIKPGGVRVRFAPSPTGALHIGTARVTLFNYLFARKNKGSFILRIEDTDKERSKPESEEDILENTQWLGLDWDEGPDPDGKKDKGEHGPYRQSQRLDIYSKYLQKLLNENKAYYCFCSEEDLEAVRQYQMSGGESVLYNGKCSHLSKQEVQKYLAEGKSCVIRARIPSKKVVFQDLIRGKVEFDSGSLGGDFTIAKGLRSPLYNFAAAVDDYEMEISHVIRGEDHIANTPKQILLCEAMGISYPQYAHLPLVLGQDRSKLSKRHGAASVTEYREEGYLPEGLINFLAFLGWNPGDEREIFNLSGLVKEFSMERVQKGGAIFNIKRLEWINGFYIRQKPLEKLAELCLHYFVEAGFIEPQFENAEGYPPGQAIRAIEVSYFVPLTKETVSFDYLKRVVSLEKERMKKLSEIIPAVDFIFKDKLEYAKDLLKWKEMTDKEIRHSLDVVKDLLSDIAKENFVKEEIEALLIPKAEAMGDRGQLLWPLRAALTGKKASAGPFEVAEVLGKERTLRRIKEAIKKL